MFRTCPFVIKERGWGEFTIYITIYFRDGTVKSIGHDLFFVPKIHEVVYHLVCVHGTCALVRAEHSEVIAAAVQE